MYAHDDDIPNAKIPYESSINYTSKLEIAILAILWCQGTVREKAQYLCTLVTKDNDESISLNNQDLQFAFIKLLQFGYDLPSRYTDEFQNPSNTD